MFKYKLLLAWSGILISACGFHPPMQTSNTHDNLSFLFLNTEQGASIIPNDTLDRNYVNRELGLKELSYAFQWLPSVILHPIPSDWLGTDNFRITPYMTPYLNLTHFGAVSGIGLHTPLVQTNVGLVQGWEYAEFTASQLNAIAGYQFGGSLQLVSKYYLFGSWEDLDFPYGGKGGSHFGTDTRLSVGYEHGVENIGGGAAIWFGKKDGEWREIGLSVFTSFGFRRRGTSVKP